MKKLISLTFILLILGGCSFGKYDGLTSKEWAEEANYWESKYRTFRTCVEDYDSFDWNEKIEWGGVFYYCE